ncbi:hypothetical protein TNCV_3692071 [Trichonephila clavipes]|nr:hypothetical protein TNCV_3692071 [Trichonephila clavipes]
MRHTSRTQSGVRVMLLNKKELISIRAEQSALKEFQEEGVLYGQGIDKPITRNCRGSERLIFRVGCVQSAMSDGELDIPA